MSNAVAKLELPRLIVVQNPRTVQIPLLTHNQSISNVSHRRDGNPLDLIIKAKVFCNHPSVRKLIDPLHEFPGCPPRLNILKTRDHRHDISLTKSVMYP